MPLETATYTSQLVSSNPAHSDGLNQADAHMRLIKGCIQATFPNFTAAALNSTQAQIDGAVGLVNTSGVTLLASAGVNFATNTTDGFANPAAGEIDIKVAGTVLAKFVNSTSTQTVNGNLVTTGTIASTGAITGPGTHPIGGAVMWFTDTLPTGYGTWAWANGGTLSRTTYAALFAMFGTTYGAGDGSTTFNVPNLQEVTPVGKSTMGGGSSPGLLPSIASGVKTVLGSIFGVDTVTLSSAQIPSHQHSVYLGNGTHQHNISFENSNGYAPGSNSALYAINHIPSAGGNVNNTLIDAATVTIGSSSGAATDNQTALVGGGGSHNNLQPSMIVNWIIRVA